MLSPTKISINVQSSDELKERVKRNKLAAEEKRIYGEPRSINEAEKVEMLITDVPAMRCNACKSIYHTRLTDALVGYTRRFLFPVNGSKRLSYSDVLRLYEQHQAG